MKLLLISFTVIILLLSGCNRNNNEVEITDNLDNSYISVSRLDEVPITTNIPAYQEQDKLLTRIKNEGFNKEKAGSKTDEYTYLLFINENGKIDKSMIVDGMGEKFDKILINSMGTWKLLQGKINGKNVKYRIIWKYNPFSGNKLNNTISDQSKASFNHSDFYVKADVMPEFLGGIQELAKKIQYPEAEKKAGTEGRVFVKVYIDEAGNVVGTEIVRSVTPNLDAAAAKAINATRFIPGKVNGKPVKTQILIPISFKLE
jgi:TonB family protein